MKTKKCCPGCQKELQGAPDKIHCSTNCSVVVNNRKRNVAAPPRGELQVVTAMTEKEKILLEQEGMAMRLQIFGPPMVWPDKELADTGLNVRIASDIEPKANPVPVDDDPLMAAARKAFPRSHKSKLALIVRRYRDSYDGIPEADAVPAILKGYSLPDHVMRSNQLKRRPLRNELS